MRWPLSLRRAELTRRGAERRPGQHWQVQRASCRRATVPRSPLFDVEFVVEISRCRAPLHRSTTQAPRPAADVELYSSTALSSALHLYSSTALYTLHPLHPPSVRTTPKTPNLCILQHHRAGFPRIEKLDAAENGKCEWLNGSFLVPASIVITSLSLYWGG